MIEDDALCPHPHPFLFQTADDVHLFNVLLDVACQDIQVVLCDCQRTMTEYLLESDHRAAHGCPFLRKGMAEAVNTCLFQSSFVAVVPDGMVATASGKLLSIDRAEKPVFHAAATILEIFLKDFDDVLIQGDNQGLAVLCGVHIDHRVVEVHIPDFDIHQTILADASREQKVDNHPTAIGGEDTLADIGLFQQFPQFIVCVSLNGSLVCFWKLDFKVGDVVALHKEPHQGLQISGIGSHRYFIQVRVFTQGDVEVRHGLLVHGRDGGIGRDSLVDLLDGFLIVVDGSFS